MSDATEPRTKATNVALIVSVCLNLILVGLIVMAVVRVAAFHPMLGALVTQRAGQGHGVPVQQVLAPRAMMHAAPAERAKIRAVIVAHRDRIAALRAQSLDARSEVLQEFSQPKFDKAAFDKALERMHASDAALESEVLKVMSESAATLTPEERQAVAQQNQNGRGPFWRRHGGDRGHGRGPQGDQHPEGD
jgi:uncharacterized membrane protein